MFASRRYNLGTSNKYFQTFISLQIVGSIQTKPKYNYIYI